MFCPKCGKQMADDAQFCEACGHRLDAAPDQTQPPAANAATQPMPPTSPTAPAAAPPPPAPAAAPAQPSSGGGHTCWIIGCVVVLLLVMLGVGGFFGVRWWMSRQTDKTTHAEPITATDEPEPGGTEEPEAEDQVREVVLAFFDAWAEGDMDAAMRLSTPEMQGDITEEEFGHGYEQYDLDLVRVEETSDGSWEVEVAETFSTADGDSASSVYLGVVVERDGQFLMDQLQVVRSDDEEQEQTEETEGDGGDDGDGSYYSALMTVYLFFTGWREGDRGKVLGYMTEELAENTSPSLFDTGYEQVELQVEEAVQVSDSKWEFTMRERFRPLNAAEGDAPLQSRYHFAVIDDGEDWVISDWDVLQGEDAPMT